MWQRRRTGTMAGLRRVLAGLLLSGLAPACLAAEEVALATLDWPPYVGQQLPDGGPVHAIVAEALARSGLQLKAAYRPWARAMEITRQGRMAGLFPEYLAEERRQDFLFSDPFPGGPIVLYRRTEDALDFAVDPASEPDKALRALSFLRFGVVRGYANTAAFDAADYLHKEEATSDEINLKKLAYGRVDLVVIDQLVAEYLLAGPLLEYAARLEPMLPALEHKDLYVAFSRAHPRARDYCEAFNRGLQVMREEGRLDALLQQHGLADTAQPATR